MTMAKIAHEPVKRAMSRIRELSADEEARRLAFVRERALRDEVSQLNEARQEGLEKGEQIGLVKGEQIGLEKGEQIGLEKGERLRAEKTARNLIKTNALSDEQIAQATGLTQGEVAQLRAERQK
ncbi:transcriptional regulator [Halorhodospira halochloris]|uniref:Transcriptional regulator n=2 Tax=Halorhodospira halochloris TaxID=1052 RepID=A0A120MZM5_HALHR|nr:transcriptional regulator [Halorhodospira halochloris]